MALRHIHKYMYQVQAQMHIADVSYCDFLVWTPQEVFTQQILYDPLFFHDAYGKVVNFIKTVCYLSCWGNGIQHHALLP